MFIKIPYKTFKKKYPDAVKHIVEQLRRSKSKSKKLAPSKLTWGYEYGIRIDEHYHSKKMTLAAFTTLTFSRVIVHLVCYTPSKYWKGYSEYGINRVFLPKEVASFYTEYAKRNYR